MGSDTTADKQNELVHFNGHLDSIRRLSHGSLCVESGKKIGNFCSDRAHDSLYIP